MFPQTDPLSTLEYKQGQEWQDMRERQERERKDLEERHKAEATEIFERHKKAYQDVQVRVLCVCACFCDVKKDTFVIFLSVLHREKACT